MSDGRYSTESDGLQVEIEPEPSPEELVAILEVVRSLAEPGDDDQRSDLEHGSRWGAIARREALRTNDWPAQRAEWTSRRR